MIPSFLPPGTYRITVRPGHPIGDTKTQRLGDLERFFFGINRTGDEGDTFFCERITAFFVAFKQATTIGSPVPAIEKYDGKRRLNI